jgi:hypothetical protein
MTLFACAVRLALWDRIPFLIRAIHALHEDHSPKRAGLQCRAG